VQVAEARPTLSRAQQRLCSLAGGGGGFLSATGWLVSDVSQALFWLAILPEYATGSLGREAYV
jgi:hypothetical protein